MYHCCRQSVSDLLFGLLHSLLHIKAVKPVKLCSFLSQNDPENCMCSENTSKIQISRRNMILVFSINNHQSVFKVFSERVMRFLNLQKIFQITILSLKFECVVYFYWREI